MNTSPDSVRRLVRAELSAASTAEGRGEFYTAFTKLERAHVLGQRSTREHVLVHWLMLRLAIRNGWAHEAFGQSWRLLMAAISTPFGLVPHGNTGGSDVNGFKPMRIPPDLQALIDTNRA